jgi:hypothetical protein
MTGGVACNMGGGRKRYVVSLNIGASEDERSHRNDLACIPQEPCSDVALAAHQVGYRHPDQLLLQAATLTHGPFYSTAYVSHTGRIHLDHITIQQLS